MHNAKTVLAEHLPALQLAADGTPAVIQARLRELKELQAASDELSNALAKQAKANGRLEQIATEAKSLGESLTETVDADLRVFSDRMTRRLEAARKAQTDHSRLTLDHEKTTRSLEQAKAEVETQTRILQQLCAAAMVADAAALPSAEDASERKRRAQTTVREAQEALAEATRRPLDAMREMIGEKTVEAFQTDEEAAAAKVENLEVQFREAQEAANAARRALDAVDTGDEANAQREIAEQALAAIDRSIDPWMRSRLGAVLLNAAMQRFRERAQGPMLEAAIRYFNRMTDDRFERIFTENEEGAPLLMVQRRGGDRRLGMEKLSEGTCDQLYLSLRMAALEMQRNAGVNLPVVFDDLLMTSDDGRVMCMLHALEEFSRGSQVVIMTHHAHMMDLARKTLPAESLMVIDMTQRAAQLQAA